MEVVCLARTGAFETSWDVVSKYLSSAIRDSDGPVSSVTPGVISGVYGAMFQFSGGTVGNAFDDDRRKCFDAGMDGYVVKPVSAKAIGEEMGSVIALFKHPQTEAVQK
jgi:hypothetical protein